MAFKNVIKVAVDRVWGVALKINMKYKRIQQNLALKRGVASQKDDRKEGVLLYFLLWSWMQCSRACKSHYFDTAQSPIDGCGGAVQL